MARQTLIDKTVLEAAIVGLEHQKSEIDAKVAEIRGRLRGVTGGSAAGKPSAGRKRVLSPAARRRISEATRKRWAEYRAAKKAKK